jgi:hypothetical protein
VKQNEEIAKELQEVAPTLSTLDKVNLYPVSEGYFQDSTNDIMAMIGELKLPSTLSQIEKKNLYPAPAPLYFESIADNILTKIHADEVADELTYSAPHLVSLPKSTIQQVHVDYFISFPEVMTQMAAHEDAAHSHDLEQLGGKWSELIERLWAFVSRPAYAMAIASCVGLIMCIGLVMNNHSLSDEDKIFAQMQQIPDSELHSYIGKHRDDYDEHTILHHIDETDFTHYFDKPEDVPAHLIDQVKGTTASEVNADDIID